MTYNVLAGMKDSRRLEGCSGILLVFGVPAEDRRFIVKSKDGGEEIKKRHWRVKEKGLVLVDWNLLREQADVAGGFDKLLMELHETDRVILPRGLAGEAMT